MMHSLLQAQNYAVIGLGRSGIAAANLLVRRGKKVLACDSNRGLDVKILSAKLDERVRVQLGSLDVGDAEVVVVSPGLTPKNTFFDTLPQHVTLIPEVDLARLVSPHRWLGITGTDGKTTTTELTTFILNQIGVKAVAAGNIGVPLCEVVEQVSWDTVVVAELSAFQMWSSKVLWLEAMAITNIAADHLDYFSNDFDAYVEAKFTVFSKMRALRTAVLNTDDPEVLKRFSTIQKNAASVVTYGTTPFKVGSQERTPHFYYDSGTKEIRLPIGHRVPWGYSESGSLKGKHNAMNAMAAMALAYCVGVPVEACIEPLKAFHVGPHRIEDVAEMEGVRWINDSKATNLHASQAGLETVIGPCIGIIGGVDKQLDLAAYADYISQKLDIVILIGSMQKRLDRALSLAGMQPERRLFADSMQEAVKKASQHASTGTTVILSPAASSFDMFKSYEDRGQKFCEAVRALILRKETGES